MRIDGKFVDSEGNRPPGQYVSKQIFGFCAFCSILFITGAAVPSETMLRLDLPAVVVERACFGGTYAYCTHCKYLDSNFLMFYLAGQQIIDSEEMSQRSVKIRGPI